MVYTLCMSTQPSVPESREPEEILKSPYLQVSRPLYSEVHDFIELPTLTNILELHDGERINPDAILPYFGHPELKEKLWDTFLAKDGAEVLLRGSTVMAFVFGGYLIDYDSGFIPLDQLSDIDVFYSDKNIVAQEFDALSVKQGRMAKKLSLDLQDGSTLQVDLTNIDDIRKSYSKVTQKIVTALDYDLTHHVDPYTINALSDFPTMDWSGKNLFYFHAFYKPEQIAIRAIRENGELNFYFVDPQKTLDALQAGDLPSLKEQFKSYIHNIFPEPLYKTKGVSPYGLQHDLVDVFLYAPNTTQNIEGAEMFMYNVGILPSRAMRNFCEQHVLLSTSELAADGWERVEQLHLISRALNDGSYFETSSGKGVKNSVTAKIQSDFARSMFQNPEDAGVLMFTHFELGNFAIPAVARKFQKYHAAWPVEFGRFSRIDADAPSAVEQTRKNLFLKNMYEEDSPAWEQLQVADDFVTSMRSIINSLYFSGDLTYSNAAEFFAIYMLAADLDELPEEELEEIFNETAQVWKPSGVTHMPWRKVSPEYADFDLTITPEILKNQFNAYRKALGRA